MQQAFNHDSLTPKPKVSESVKIVKYLIPKKSKKIVLFSIFLLWRQFPPLFSSVLSALPPICFVWVCLCSLMLSVYNLFKVKKWCGRHRSHKDWVHCFFVSTLLACSLSFVSRTSCPFPSQVLFPVHPHLITCLFWQHIALQANISDTGSRMVFVVLLTAIESLREDRLTP